MCGIHHISTGAGCARPGGGNVNGDRHGGSDDGLNDAAHGQVQPAWRIKLDDDDFRPGRVGLLKSSFQIIRDGRANSVVDTEQDGLRARLAVQQPHRQRHTQHCKNPPHGYKL